MSHEALSQSEIVLYQTEDGRTRLQVRLQDETVWLTQKLMAELFQTSVPNVSMHIRNVFAAGELQADSVVKDFLITAADGKSYATLHCWCRWNIRGLMAALRAIMCGCWILSIWAPLWVEA